MTMKYKKPSQAKHIGEIDPKYLPPKDDPSANWSDDPKTMAFLLERAYNIEQNEKRAKAEAKLQEEEQRRMKEYEERQRQEREQREEQRRLYIKNLPERQLQMFLSGRRDVWRCCGHKKLAEYFNQSMQCQNFVGENIEPGLNLLKQEYSAGRILRLDEQTHNRLVGFAIPDEGYTDLINRLLDLVTTEAQRSRSETLRIKKLSTNNNNNDNVSKNV